MYQNKDCPICKAKSKIQEEDYNNYWTVKCPNCGTIKYWLHKNIEKEYEQALVRHWIKKNQRKGEPLTIDDKVYEKIINYFELPNAKEQADNLIYKLGNELKTPAEKTTIHNPEDWAAIIGAKDEDGLGYILERLKENGLINIILSRSKSGYGLENTNIGLTFEGWDRFDHIKKGDIESNIAFMAMEFNNDELDEIFFQHLKPAVRMTGFDLRRLDEKPEAGLIDNRLRTEIRRSVFVIADLTNDNCGAYWEAGFAEALDKPVIYMCERSHFENFKTHFDTNHHYTVIYEFQKIKEASEELKATIRATLPHVAKMEDE